MNWETIGWLALCGSGILIGAGFMVGRKAAPAGHATVAAGENPHPLHAWLEIAWPVFFIAAMGMLALKEILGFAAVLLLATTITGLIWGVDSAVLRSKRGAAAEPIVVEMARSFFPVILIVFLLRSFLYEPFKIPSESMLPTLQVGDFILVNKFTYGVRLPVINRKIVETNSPQRGDVMVFRYPEDPAKDFIKRVVGLPGDRIAYVQKRLSINDTPIDTQSLGTATEVDKRLGFRRFESFREKFGEKSHTIMADPDMPGVRLGGVRQFPNRDNCEYNNSGVVCTVPSGHYFMMGDNRDNSDDSRYWGFVPEQNIVGKAVLIWMNFGSFKRIGSTIE
ncbi:MAG: signal peptidase I [Betaproteobacteria bacterium]